MARLSLGQAQENHQAFLWFKFKGYPWVKKWYIHKRLQGHPPPSQTAPLETLYGYQLTHLLVRAVCSKRPQYPDCLFVSSEGMAHLLVSVFLNLLLLLVRFPGPCLVVSTRPTGCASRSSRKQWGMCKPGHLSLYLCPRKPITA